MKSRCLALGLSSLFVSMVAASDASAQQLRFTTTQPGNVVATGNTLGLSKELALNGPGTQDAIGTFSTLLPGSVDDFPLNLANPWFEGTTNDWHENGSTATLSLPSDAEILYAELVWGGSFNYGDEDVSLQLDSTVKLTSDGDSIDVPVDPTTAVTLNVAGSFPIRYYMRSADVTSFVASHLGGTYSAEGIPATQSALSNNANAAGWTLVIAYRYDGEPIRNMTVFVGGLFVDEDTTVDYPVSGFCAPPSEPIEGTIAIATLEGDSSRVGDQLAIGETAADPTFVPLSGPNNPVNNFFCSQINGPNGDLDTSGTFGDRNSPLGSTGNGVRQGWDVAHIALTSDAGHLVPDQTSAVLRTQTNDDSYMPVLAGIAIDVNAPKFLYDNSTTTVDKDSVMVGDDFKLTVKLVNEGSAPANDVRFTLALPAGISLSSFTTNGAAGDINGGNVTLAMVGTGVDMGDIGPDDSRIVEATFEVAAPQTEDIALGPIWKYGYKVCINDATTNEEFKATVVSVDYVDETSTGGGGQGGAGAGGGTGEGGAGNTGNAGGGGGGLEVTPEGGGLFRCSVEAPRPVEGPSAALLALGATLLLRRRRR